MHFIRAFFIFCVTTHAFAIHHSHFYNRGVQNVTISNSTNATTYEFITFAAASCTDGTSEVARTLAVYNVGSDSGKADLAIHSLDTLMGYFGQTNRLSFKYQTDDIVGFMWLGSMVQNQGAKEIMKKLQDVIKSQGMKDTIYAQYTDVSTHDPAKGFGIILNTQGDLDMVQSAVRSWSRGHDFRGTDAGRSATINSYLCYTSYADRKTGGNDGEAGDCEYKRMTSGANVGDLCGTTSEAVQMYNSDIDFTKLAVGQPICCTEGKSPDLRPSKNSDGSCKVFQFQDGDSCATVKTKYYPLSDDELNKFNKETFGWYGCKDQNHLPQINQKICVSDGTPPRPEPNPEAECGPLAPGDKYNSKCPLNACCSEFGFCGITSEFCETRESDTNAPGTTGCVSNCGLPKLPSKGHKESNTGFKNIQYFMTSDGPLKGDPSSIIADIVHFGFVDIGDDLEIKNIEGNNDFINFLDIAPLKVASFGGWDFSTNKDTYNIFRKGVSEENRDHFANVMIAFLNKYNLDGLDFDWEYPGEPDIPGIPSDDKDNGKNYLEFLKIVKSRLPEGKTISVALPASYWYLKAFPVEDMQDVVDYFIYMNYDYYGQWDYDKGIGIGCHVAYTNTTNAIAMLNKAGVKPEKVVGGLANYGRSYQLSDPSCTDTGCPFTGPSSGAIKGPDTQTAGMLSIKEINEVKANYSDYTEWTDDKCTIATFNKDNWVGFMKSDDRNDVSDSYQDFNYHGSVTWLSNYGGLSEVESESVQNEDNYLGEITGYYDIFNCYGNKVENVDDIDKVSLACKYQAGVNYLLHLGDEIKSKFQKLLDDADYSAHYKKYTEYVQSNITNAYKASMMGGMSRFQSTSSDSLCRDTCTDTTCYLACDDDKISVFDIGCPPARPGCSPGGGNVGCTGPYYQGCTNFMFMAEYYELKDESSRKEVSKEISDLMGMNIKPDSFEVIDVSPEKMFQLQFEIKSVEMPKVAKLIPDPMKTISKDNITDIENLQKAAKDNMDKMVPSDILNLLLPITMYSDVAHNAESINKAGGEIEKIEEEQTKDMIKGIIFSIFGVVSMAAGAEIGILLDALTVLIELGIDGSPNAADVAVLGGGIFGFVFKEIKQIENVAKVATKVEKITMDGKAGRALSKVASYRHLMNKYGKVCKK